MQIEIEKIKPEDAVKYLDLNPNNRPLNESRVIKYSNQMKEGKWKVNGESIVFSKNGRLVDGQHRLQAIVRSGETVETLVIRGVDDDAFETIDTGTSRSAADLLGISGVSRTNCGLLASMISQDLIMGKTRDTSSGRYASLVTPQNILRAYEENPKYLETLQWLLQFPKKNIPLSINLMGAIVYRMIQIDEDFSKPWLEGFLTGANLPLDDIRLHFLRKLEKDKFNLTKIPGRIKKLMLIKIWDYSRQDKLITKLVVSPKNWNAIRLPSDEWK